MTTKKETTVTEGTMVSVGLIVILVGGLLSGVLRVETVAGRVDANTSAIKELKDERKILIEKLGQIEVRLARIEERLPAKKGEQ